MKRLFSGITALLVAPLTPAMPGLASIPIISRMLEQPMEQESQLIMHLSLDKKVVTKQVDGSSKMTWARLEDNAMVHSGSILRYNIEAQNQGEQAANFVAITVPIPPQTLYKINSVSLPSDVSAKLTYSIDHGKTFVVKPIVQLKQPDGTMIITPAPPDRYTHVRLMLNQSILPEDKVNAAFQVKVY